MKRTATGTYLYNLKTILDDGSIKDGDYASLLLERLDHAITLFDRQEEGINSVKVGGRELHAIKDAITRGSGAETRRFAVGLFQ